ncbi:MAG: relaxase/mobilization nuclease domain-containing protein [Mangrovibacterium sp.]
MIVKILSKTGTFSAVRYNTNKMDRHAGELMRIKNFGILGNAFDLTPEEVKNYLKTFSAANKRVKSPQFHATISCKGREYDKEQLADIAEKWLAKMGYEENPYLIIFHSDTDNNHVHVVSTRVAKDGKKIDDRFDRPRAIRYLDEILKQDIYLRHDEALKSIECYTFSTLPQFKMLLEKMSFTIRENDGILAVWKAGELIKEYSPEELRKMTGSYEKDSKRLAQLRQIIHKYKAVADNTLTVAYQKLPGGRNGRLSGYQSDLTDLLHEKFGLEFIFHSKGDRPPYGYTVIDHKARMVVKGSEVMKLNELLDLKKEPRKASKRDKIVSLISHYNIENPGHVRLLSRFYKVPVHRIKDNDNRIDSQGKESYRKMLDYYLKHHPLVDITLLNITPVKESGTWYLIDAGSLNILNADEVLSENYIGELDENRIFELDYDRSEHNNELNLNVFNNDEDDERVHGRKRRKKKRDIP